MLRWDPSAAVAKLVKAVQPTLPFVYRAYRDGTHRHQSCAGATLGGVRVVAETDHGQLDPPPLFPGARDLLPLDVPVPLTKGAGVIG